MKSFAVCACLIFSFNAFAGEETSLKISFSAAERIALSLTYLKPGNRYLSTVTGV